MQNWLLVSDIHLGEFHYQYDAEVRYEKYLETAKNILKIYNSNNCTRLCILGDFLDKSVSSPSVLIVFKEMLNIWKDCNIHFILGQHDFESRTADLNKSYIKIFDTMTYMDGKTETIENLTISWSDYSRESKIESPKCDIFLSHISFGFIDYKPNCRLTIAGDIHEQKNYNNNTCYAIGTPIQIHPSEPVQGDVILLTLDSGNFEVKRIQLPVILELKKLERINKVKTQTKLELPTLDKLIQENNLTEVYSLLDKENLPTPINLEFTINKVRIHNFKGIKDYEIDFTKLGKIVYVKAGNGVGKSSILDAIYYTLTGDKHIKDFQNIHESDPVECEVEFTYENNVYSIIRNVSQTKIIDSGKDITDSIKGKRQVDSFIKSKFPFTTLLKFFYVKTYENFFDENKRLDLFTEVFNLNMYKVLSDRAKDLLKSTKSNIKTIELEIASSTGSLNTNKDSYKNLLEKFHTYDRFKGIKDTNDLESKINELQEKKTNFEILKSKMETLKSSILQVNFEKGSLRSHKLEVNEDELLKIWDTIDSSKIKDLEMTKELSNKISKLNTLISNKKSESSIILNLKSSQSKIIETRNSIIESSPHCPKCGTIVEVDHSTLDKEIEDLDSKLKSHESKLQNLESEIVNQTSIVESDKKSLEEFRSSVPSNPKYSRVELVDSKSINDRLKEKTNKIKELESNLDSLQREYNSINQSEFNELQSLNQDLIDLRERFRLYNELTNLKTIIEKLSSEISEKNSNKENLESLIDKIHTFITLFDIKNPDSLPVKVLSSITNQLTNPDMGLEFTTLSQLKNGNSVLDINCKYKGVQFDSCSCGERVMISIIILQVVLETLGNVGLLFLDETLSTLSESNYHTTCDRIRSLNSNLIVLTSHLPGFNFYDNLIEL